MSKAIREKSAASPRREAILRGALESFEALGFEASTVEDIRRRSRASVGSIYHHFGSKVGIAAGLYLEGLATYQSRLVARMRRARSAKALVQSVVAQHLDWAQSNPAWARYLLRQRRLDAVAAFEPERSRRNADFLAEVLPLFEPYVRSGEITRLPPEILLATLIGPAQEFLRSWLFERAEIGIGKAKPLLVEAAWKSVRAG